MGAARKETCERSILERADAIGQATSNGERGEPWLSENLDSRIRKPRTKRRQNRKGKDEIADGPAADNQNAGTVSRHDRKAADTCTRFFAGFR